MSAADFAAMTGADEQAAAMYLEMAGGNMEIAVSIFFDGGGAPPAPPAPPAAGDDEHAAAAAALVGAGGSFPNAWLDQGLKAEFERGQLVVRQHGNGPCGVLAAAHALAATYGLADGAAALRRAAAAMVAACGVDGEAKVARWAGDVGGAVTHDVVAADVGAVEARVGAAFEARGGVALLVYSCVLSRGAARCLADAAVDGGGGPLVFGPFHLCTTELLNLLLFGVARGDVGAYGGGAAAKADWRGAAPVGLLSADEVESGVPVADELKSPAGRAWIVHGGAARRPFFRASRVLTRAAQGPTSRRSGRRRPTAGPWTSGTGTASRRTARSASSGSRPRRSSPRPKPPAPGGRRATASSSARSSPSSRRTRRTRPRRRGPGGRTATSSRSRPRRTSPTTPSRPRGPPTRRRRRASRSAPRTRARSCVEINQ